MDQGIAPACQKRKAEESTARTEKVIKSNSNGGINGYGKRYDKSKKDELRATLIQMKDEEGGVLPTIRRAAERLSVSLSTAQSLINEVKGKNQQMGSTTHKAAVKKNANGGVSGRHQPFDAAKKAEHCTGLLQLMYEEGGDIPSLRKAAKRLKVCATYAGKLIKETVTDPVPFKLHTSGVVCFLGKLIVVQKPNKSDINNNNTVHRIAGMWSSGLDHILEDPKNENGRNSMFELIHDLAQDELHDFPVSGSYSGWFHSMEGNGGKLKKIFEKHIILHFIQNSEGTYNVVGYGTNSIGKYSITGILKENNVITLFRFYTESSDPTNKEVQAVDNATGAEEKENESTARNISESSRIEDIETTKESVADDRTKAITEKATASLEFNQVEDDADSKVRQLVFGLESMMQKLKQTIKDEKHGTVATENFEAAVGQLDEALGIVKSMVSSQE